jgi:O-antigen/teichoic acid export membrane protein
MKGLLRRANQAVPIVSLGLALLAALIAWNLSDRFDPQMLISFWVALTMLPLLTLNSLRQAALVGLNKVTIGQLPVMIIQPMIFVFLIGASYLILAKGLTALWALEMNVLAVGVTFVISTKLLHRNLPKAAKEIYPIYKTRIWAYSALPLMVISGMQLINARADIILLGAMKGTKAAGIYVVANRGAELITFALLAVNTALAPTIASLYAKRDMKRLQQLITRSARIILFTSLPIGLGLIFFGNWFLSFFFGGEFAQGKTALSILSISQIVNVATGSVWPLLIMTGHEREATAGIGISALFNIIMNVILIPKWEVEGAAAATASNIIIWNIVLVVWVYKRLGIHSTALGRFGLRRRYEKT